MSLSTFLISANWPLPEWWSASSCQPIRFPHGSSSSASYFRYSLSLAPSSLTGGMNNDGPRNCLYRRLNPCRRLYAGGPVQRHPSEEEVGFLLLIARREQPFDKLRAPSPVEGRITNSEEFSREVSRAELQITVVSAPVGDARADSRNEGYDQQHPVKHCHRIPPANAPTETIDLLRRLPE